MNEPYTARLVTGIRDFLRLEAAAGIVLGVATLLALVVSNSGLAGLYGTFLDLPVELRVGALHIAKPLLLWINDGLMAIFFLLVGLEIKRELVEGELSSLRQAMLPALAAVGGMAVPALLYVACNLGNPVALRGWAIPAATDIAFAVGVLSLLGRRVPIGLKIFLLALAIFDDLGAIVIIAVFYTANLSVVSLLLAAAVLLVMLILNRLGVTRIAPYALLGIVLWVCVLKSGVHATLAGVAMALAVPVRDADGESPLKRLEHTLHPWVAFLVVPLFGFANAGVSFAGVTGAALLDGVSLGIAAGLFIGKQIGVVGAVVACVRLGWARLPDGVTWLGLYGVALLAGIGFTMSLFIGTLAWDNADHAVPLRLGVLAGSLLSGIVGYVLLRRAVRPPPDAS
ncbi:MAG TPA: Na+/H+ antiporter NhaA [Methylomirabilota bacterium]|nr:Na+/H+ antiporter NhaA [Methylomirabilota bacterium]